MLGCQIVAMSAGFTTELSSSTDTDRRLTVPGGVLHVLVRPESTALLALRRRLRVAGLASPLVAAPVDARAGDAEHARSVRAAAGPLKLLARVVRR